MRCLALAQGWQAHGGVCLFALSGHCPGPETRLQEDGFAFIHLTAPPGSAAEAQELAQLALTRAAAWLVLDGYHFDHIYQSILKEAGLRLLVIDDLGEVSFYCSDLILNQNLYASASLYRARAPATQLLLGPEYALLRREFWPWRRWRRVLPARADRLLLTLGGGDQTAALQRLAPLAVLLPDLQVTVAGGWSQEKPMRTALQELAPTWRWAAAGEPMPALMAAADLAVTGAGGTCWELAFMELPTLLVILADNQRRNAESLHQRQAAFNLGWHADLDPQRVAAVLGTLRESKAQRLALINQGGRRLVDGQGVMRVISWLQHLKS